MFKLWLAIVRSALFNLLFFLTFPIILLLYLPVLFIQKGPPVVFAKFSSLYTLWLLKIICGTKCRVIGLENVPEGPCILASKHQSAWDTFSFLTIFPDISYVIKIELQKLPIYGAYMKKHGNIALDRDKGRKSLLDLKVKAQKILQQNRKIIIFPEGARVEPGAPADYQKGILVLYKDTTCPIIPVALNSGQYWGRRSWIKWPGVITIQFLPQIPQGLDNDTFMDQLTTSIETASRKLMQA